MTEKRSAPPSSRKAGIRVSPKSREAERAADLKASKNTVIAGICAFVLIAHQVGGKASRDGAFLTTFDVSHLPWVVMFSAAVSLVAALVASRFLERYGPQRMVFAGLILSGTLQGLLFLLSLQFLKAAVVSFYLHMTAFSVVLISTYWTMLGESFDPRRTRRAFGQIAIGASLGGVAGGLLAAWGAPLFGKGFLLVLGGMHMLCAGLVTWIKPLKRHRAQASSPAKHWLDLGGLKQIRQFPNLRSIALFLFLVTMGSVLLDFAFKARAVEANPETGLIRFFALYYAIIGVVTFLIQSSIGRYALEKAGVILTMAVLPLAAGIGAIAALIVPSLGAVSVARAIDASLKSSLHRSGYESLFSVIPTQQKLSAKVLIDVGVSRLADVIGAGLVIFLLGFGTFAQDWILISAAVVFIAATFLLPRLRRVYLASLENRMQEHIPKSGSLAGALLQSKSGLDFTMVTPGNLGPNSLLAGLKSDQRRRLVEQESQIVDAWTADLLSHDVVRVRMALVANSAPSITHIANIISLLSWDDVSRDVIDALKSAGPNTVEPAIKILLSQDEDFAIRRRIPRVLSAFPTDDVAVALEKGLQDGRFEVRYQCGLALLRHHRRNQDSVKNTTAIRDAILQALHVSHAIWRNAILLDDMKPEEESFLIDSSIRDRADRSMEHVFNLLTLILPAEPIKMAFRGLHTGDPALRGIALEYLENALPQDIRQSLFPFLEEASEPDESERRGRETILKDLMLSRTSIDAALATRLPEDGK